MSGCVFMIRPILKTLFLSWLVFPLCSMETLKNKTEETHEKLKEQKEEGFAPLIKPYIEAMEYFQDPENKEKSLEEIAHKTAHWMKEALGGDISWEEIKLGNSQYPAYRFYLKNHKSTSQIVYVHGGPSLSFTMPDKAENIQITLEDMRKFKSFKDSSWSKVPSVYLGLRPGDALGAGTNSLGFNIAFTALPMIGNLVQKGHEVIVLNYPGNFLKEYGVDLDFRKVKSQDQIADIEKQVEDLAQRYPNSHRTYWGHSYGGELGSALLLQDSKILKYFKNFISVSASSQKIESLKELEKGFPSHKPRVLIVGFKDDKTTPLDGPIKINFTKLEKLDDMTLVVGEGGHSPNHIFSNTYFPKTDFLEQPIGLTDLTYLFSHREMLTLLESFYIEDDKFKERIEDLLKKNNIPSLREEIEKIYGEGNETEAGFLTSFANALETFSKADTISEFQKRLKNAKEIFKEYIELISTVASGEKLSFESMHMFKKGTEEDLKKTEEK